MALVPMFPLDFRGEVAGVPNKRGVGKIRTFQAISRGISETVQDRTTVTISIND